MDSPLATLTRLEAGRGNQAPHGSRLAVLIIVGALAVLAIVGVLFVRRMLAPLPVGTPASPSPSATVTPSRTPTPSVSPSPARLTITHAGPGVCFEEQKMKDSGNTYIYPLDCTAPHNSEVFYSAAMPAGDYPSDDAWQALVVQYCRPAFQAYVGKMYGVSHFAIGIVHAPKSVWDAGNRLLMCYAIDPSGDRTTSVKGVSQ